MGPPNGTGTSPVNSRGWWGIPAAKERGPYVSILGTRVRWVGRG
jgi:hypothetical protein